MPLPLPQKLNRLLLRTLLPLLSCVASLAHAAVFDLPPQGTSVVGHLATVVARYEDTLADIARQFGVGHQEIRLANPDVDFWLPGDGTRVLIPGAYVLPDAEPRGIVLNVPEMRLYYFPDTSVDGDTRPVLTFPVSIGRMDWSTPLGNTTVSAKTRNPSWTPPASIHAEAAARGETLPTVVPPGPDNPLGAHALRLAIPGYLIHGTNRPSGVGMRVTHGCVRMYPEDIEDLFGRIAVGTPVEIVNQPVKLGWLRDVLYIEVHPPLEEDEQGIGELRRLALDLLAQADAERPFRLSGSDLETALQQRTGIPVPISRAD